MARTEDQRYLTHYLVEKELATRLRESPVEERAKIYPAIYDELFRRVPDHPQLSVNPDVRKRAVRDRWKFVRRFCRADSCLLEIGAGDCEFSITASAHVRHVVGVDVSQVIVSAASHYANLEVLVVDEARIPLPDRSVDVAYSDQLIEHLHPDDLIAQLREVRRLLTPSGIYICITPNRVTGPHDVSGLFSDVAEGLHLREYSTGDLQRAFREAGFTRLRFYLGGRGRFVRVPSSFMAVAERAYPKIPRDLRKRLRQSPVAYGLLGINAVADGRAPARAVPARDARSAASAERPPAIAARRERPRRSS